MLGGLYGDLPPPSQSSSSAAAGVSAVIAIAERAPASMPIVDGHHQKKLSSRAMTPTVVRKAAASGILAPPPSVLRNQSKPKPLPVAASPLVIKPPVVLAPAPTREIDLLSASSDPPAPGNHLVGASSCIEDEYDPSRPNDYEEYFRERKRRKMEEEVKRDMERRRKEEEEKEMQQQKEVDRPKVLETHISGEEAWRRRGMLSRGASDISAAGGASSTSPTNHNNSNSSNAEVHQQPAAKQQQNQGGMSAAQRMMARMGWKEGQGLGKQEQGITTPLVARKTDKRAGVIVNAGELKKQKPTPTRVVLLRNMVGPGEVDSELEEEVASECSKFGVVTSVLIYEIIEQDYNPTEAVRIFIQFERPEQASQALQDLDGRFFGGRVVKGCYFDEDRFARNELAPLPGEHS